MGGKPKKNLQCFPKKKYIAFKAIATRTKKNETVSTPQEYCIKLGFLSKAFTVAAGIFFFIQLASGDPTQHLDTL